MPLLKAPEPPAGARPGTLTVIPDELRTRISLLSYNATDSVERSITETQQLGRVRDASRRHWVSVQGLGDRDWLNDVSGFLGLPQAVIEALVSATERPKTEWSEAGALIVLRTPYRNELGASATEQIGVFVGETFLLTVQETHSDTLWPPWSRIVQGFETSRRESIGQLAYLVVDAAVDSFFPVLEEIGDSLEDLEERVMESSDEEVLTEVNRVRSTLVNMRRAIWPQREAIQRLMRNDRERLDSAVAEELRGVYEHCMQISEMIESYRDLVGSINGTYLAAVSNRTNEVMRVLTIMASLFIPLTFVAGIYGMNFEHMPELSYPYAYPLVWVVMISVTAGMLLYFRRKGWIGGGAG